MTEEDEEFQRLEREIKMRRRAEEDDDTQEYKRQWVGLTDEEIDRYFDEQWGGNSSYHDCFKEVMRWQESKLKEKNT